jgi:polyphosphate kinase
MQREDPMADTRDDEPEADGKLKRREYERELGRLHVEFVKLQRWVVHKGLKVCILFEGRDGAGKGGTIKAMTERVMGFCTEEEAKRFLEMVPSFERVVVDSGIILLKYWLEVSPEEQTRRLEARIDDGRKTWKLSDMNLKSYSRWFDYSRARDEMFLATDTSWTPWYVVHSDNKRRARLNVLTHILSKIPYEEPPRSKVELPKRQHRGDYKESDYPFRMIPEIF